MKFFGKNITDAQDQDSKLVEHDSRFYRARAEAGKRELKQSWLTFLKTGVFMFVLVAIFFASLAWFINARQVDSSGMAVQAKGDSVSVDRFDTFYYVQESGGYVCKKYDQSQTGMVNMLAYDLLSLDETSRNEYTPVVIRVPITGEAIDLVKPLVVTVFCTGDFTNGSTIDGNFSNITQVQCGVLTEGKEGEANDVVWSYAKSAFSATGTYPTRTFVQLQNQGTITGATKYTSVSFALSNYATTVVDGVNTAYVYLLVDYNKPLSTTYVSVNRIKGGDIGTSASLVNFNNDFSSIVIREAS